MAGHAHGSQFQMTWVGWRVHGFTHVDAPRHMLADGTTTSDFNLDQLIGRAAVIDLTSLKPNEPITLALLSHIKVYNGWFFSGSADCINPR